MGMRGVLTSEAFLAVVLVMLAAPSEGKRGHARAFAATKTPQAAGV